MGNSRCLIGDRAVVGCGSEGHLGAGIVESREHRSSREWSILLGGISDIATCDLKLITLFKHPLLFGESAP